MALLPLLIASSLLTDPLASLNKDDRTAIQMLGERIIVDGVEIDPVVRASDWLPLQPSSFTYTRTDGTNAGQQETISILGTSRVPGAPVGSHTAGWSQKDPKSWTRYLNVTDHGIHVPTSLNVPNAVISTFEPAEPLILAGIAVGESVKTTLSVKVFDINDPTVVAHSGTLDVVYKDLGGFKVTVPAGTFDTRLIKITYNGSIGPASVSDSAWVFYAKGVGPVAFVNYKDVSAFLIYNKDTRYGAVLESYDPSTPTTATSKPATSPPK